MKIGIIRETKTPADTRVCLPPQQCAAILAQNPAIQIAVQQSESRCFTDIEYEELGVPLQEDMSDCDVLLGVKEVNKDALIEAKQYFFFSHTIKKQSYNKSLLQKVLEKKIQLVDYETLTNNNGVRVIAFGPWAGVVGAHNGILTWGKRKGRFELKPMKQCFDFEEAKSNYTKLDLKGLKLVITGTGRVSNGSAEVLDLMNIKKLSSEAFLAYQGEDPVYCMLSTKMLFAKGENNDFDEGFFTNPKGYHSIMAPYLSKANLLINGIYWDNKAPVLFTKETMKNKDFSIEVIADITCDIAPVSSIPSTLRASTIENPIFGYDPASEQESSPFQAHTVDMMTVDNLPNELPRDASTDFGNQFIEHVLPELLENQIDMIHRASITTKEGALNEPYLYLSDYIAD